MSILCPRCGEKVEGFNGAVALTEHYENTHPKVVFLRMAAEIVAACGARPKSLRRRLEGR